MPNFVFKLFVMGQSPRSQRAVANLRRLCDEELGDTYHLDVIDVLERPQAAEDARILATPTLIKELPLPARRVIGDLSDPEKVLLGLDLTPNRPGRPAAGDAPPSRRG
ncbi:MAG TPA: circadian clock KaiB family protein [Gemmataceae bacterium]|jgi:circadian clock protein KaiB